MMKPDKIDPNLDAQMEENDPIWRLLGQAPLPEPDAWFTARTLSLCRNEVQSKEWYGAGFLDLARMWRWVLGSGVALTFALALTVSQLHFQKPNKQQRVQEAFEIMASIDTDSDSSPPPWQDTSL